MCCWRKTLLSEMRLPVIVSCVLLAAVTPALSDEPINFPRIAAQLSRAQLMESVGALAGFDGRQSGTPGGEAAAAYIVRRLPKAMLQSFPVNTLTIDAPVQVEILSGAQSKRRVPITSARYRSASRMKSTYRRADTLQEKDADFPCRSLLTNAGRRSNFHAKEDQCNGSSVS